MMARYDPDDVRTVVAAWSKTGAAFPVGASASLGGHDVQTMVFRTGRPARIDDYASASGPIAKAAREFGLHASLACTRLWECRS
jgi:hypothetical protein